jgi:biopolymer transport protein ExbD
MAEVTNNSGAKRSLSKPRSKKHSLRVDLTPMVDLAFLLIAFFMLTVAFNQSKAMELDKRINDKITPQPIGDCQVLNVLIDSADNIYAYEGLEAKEMKRSSFDKEHGIRQMMMNKVQRVKRECGVMASGENRQMVCLIKLLPGSHYQSMVSILDEASIVLNAGQYSLQEALPEELKALEEQKKLLAENK